MPRLPKAATITRVPDTRPPSVTAAGAPPLPDTPLPGELPLPSMAAGTPAPDVPGTAGPVPVTDQRGDRRPATEDEARALASAIRLRILRLCLDRALTNKEIAARLDVHPATTLHHVRKLVATGFLAQQDERRGARGAREVPYRATRKSWTLDVHEHRIEGSGQAMISAFLDEIAYVDIDARQPDGDLQPGTGLTRLGLRLPPDQLVELHKRMADLLGEFVARPAYPDGVPYSVFVALYADVTRD